MSEGKEGLMITAAVCHFRVLAAVSGGCFVRQSCRGTSLTGNYYEFLSSWERRPSWMDFPAVRFVVDVVCHGDHLFAYFYETDPCCIQNNG